MKTTHFARKKTYVMAWFCTFLLLNELHAELLDNQLSYILPEYRGEALLDQCARRYYKADKYWKVTKKQVQFLEKKLSLEIKKLNDEKAPFIPKVLPHYKRQYIGLNIGDKKYFYGNFFPKEAQLKVDPQRFAVVSCLSNQDYWGVLFDIKAFKFLDFEANTEIINHPISKKKTIPKIPTLILEPTNNDLEVSQPKAPKILPPDIHSIHMDKKHQKNIKEK